MSAEVDLLRETPTQPEWPDGSYALVGDIPSQRVYQRDDDEARRGDWGDWRWFDIANGDVDPLPWVQLVLRRPERLYLRGDLPTSVAAVLDAAERVGADR